MNRSTSPPGRYRKPPAICRTDDELEAVQGPDAVRGYAARVRRRLEARVADRGFRLRLGTHEDIAAIDRFQRKLFPPETATLESPYVLYRLVHYGHALLIEDARGRLVGCYTGQSYDDAERTSWGVRVAVDPAAGGNNFGALMATYSSLLAMERGARVRKAFMSPVNFGSVANVLNHVGYVCEKFYRDLPGFGVRFLIALPLTPAGLHNNRVDEEKARRFVAEHEAGKDYALVAPEDTDAIARLYRDSPFRLAGFFKTGVDGGGPRLLALPAAALGLGEKP